MNSTIPTKQIPQQQGQANGTTRWYGNSNWFSLPRAIRYDDRLSHADVRVLLAIASFDMKGGSIHPPRWQLAIYTGITESNISKRTKNLAKLGWVTIISRKGKVNHFLLHTPEYVTAREIVIREAVRAEIAVRSVARNEDKKNWCKTYSATGNSESSDQYDYEEEDDFLQQAE